MPEQTQATVGQKISATIGAFIALVFNDKVLLIRRKQEQSIVPGVSFFGNLELPGGAVEETGELAGYGRVVQTALQKFKEKTGYDLVRASFDPTFFYSMQTNLFRDAKGGYDLSTAMALDVSEKVFEELQGENFVWATLTELNQFARDFVSATDAMANGLPSAIGIVSGYGRCMHCMALYALYMEASTIEVSEEVASQLEDIEESWTNSLR